MKLGVKKAVVGGVVEVQLKFLFLEGDSFPTAMIVNSSK